MGRFGSVTLQLVSGGSTTMLVAEFRPPSSSVGQRLVRPFVSPAMAENRVDLLDAMIRDAGAERVRNGFVRPWTYDVLALKPAVSATCRASPVTSTQARTKA